MTALDYRFEPYSPRSRHWIDFAEAGELDQLAAEVERTMTAAVAANVAKVDKGQLTRADADREQMTWRVIAAELKGELVPEAAPGVPWTMKVSNLRAEIQHRRKTYPADVGKGRLAPEQARAQLERLEAVQYHYFNMGFAFDGGRDALRAHANALSDALEQQLAAA